MTEPTAQLHDSRVVDERNPVPEGDDYVDLSKIEFDDEDEQARKAARKPESEPQPEPDNEDDQIPEQLRGKTPAQLAKMYQDLHSAFGRQGGELGELRKLTDSFIKQHLKPAAPEPKKEEPKKDDDIDFFKDPRTSVRKAIEEGVAEHPEVKRLREQNEANMRRDIERARAENAAKFQEQHPDAEQILANPDFRKWIEGSKVRRQLLYRAHTAYDLDAANEVFSTWKALHPAPAEGEPAPAAADKGGKKRMPRTPTGGNANPQARGSGGKKYRRADLVRLMEEDPKRYEAMSDEIYRAYAEGRVV